MKVSTRQKSVRARLLSVSPAFNTDLVKAGVTV